VRTDVEKLQDDFGACLEVQVKREKLQDAYQLMKKYVRVIDSETAFARWAGLCRSTVWHLFHEEARMPLLRTLRKMGRFLVYHLGRSYSRSYGWTPEEMASILLGSETLRQDLIAKLTQKPERET
jgi:hypothetical protein